jgi:hypothetical protein
MAVEKEPPLKRPMWVSRISDGARTLVVWAAAWAAVGRLVSVTDTQGALSQLWLGPPIGLGPGLLGSVIFLVLLAIIGGGRQPHELSLSRVVACGGMAGAAVGVLPFIINSPANEAPLWLVAMVVIGSMALLGTISAAVSHAVTRRVSAESPRWTS